MVATLYRVRPVMQTNAKTVHSARANSREYGARGRIRTTDTAIFSRLLYQLSYPGMGAAP